MDENSLNKVMKGARAYLRRRGLEPIDLIEGSSEIVAEDSSGKLVFAQVKASDDTLPSADASQRAREVREELAIWWLKDHPEHADAALQFDLLSICLLTDDRAIIRHHQNCFGPDASHAAPTLDKPALKRA